MSKLRTAMLTTTDNPFDPFDDFRKWFEFDMQHNYGTTEYLSRIVKISDCMSEKDQNEAVEQAIDEIIKINDDLFGKGFYKKVVKEEDCEFDYDFLPKDEETTS